MVHSKQGHLVQQHLDKLIVERSCLELVDLVERRCHLSTRAGAYYSGLVVVGKLWQLGILGWERRPVRDAAPCGAPPSRRVSAPSPKTPFPRLEPVPANSI